MNEPLSPRSAAPLRVLLIAEDPLVRANLAGIIQSDPGLVLVGQGLPRAPGVRSHSSSRPEVILWDAGWQNEAAEGWEALSQAGAAVILMVPDEAAARGAWAAGARGVLSRDAESARIQAALA
ncbi:MAG: DNA-binding response regulator, partial [Anaerolineales bacterium]